MLCSTGVYLHDPRCICKEAKTKTRRKNKEDVVLDALFWPVMPYSMVAAKLDMNRQPHVIQSYSVPLPQPDQYRKHDTAVYSMWMHFVDFCLANSESSGLRDADASPCFSAPDKPYNSYTEEQRLKFFQFLSSCNGRPVSRDELIRATSTGVQIPARHQAFFDAAPAVPVRRPSVPLSHSMSGTMEEPLNPYFSSSEAPLDSVYDPAAGRAYGQSQMGPAGPGRSAGAFPPASPHHPLHSVPERDVYAQPAPYMNANMSNMSGNVGIGGGMGDREKAIRRASRTSSQSASPVTVTACERSPHRAPGSLAAQAQQRVAIGASLGTIGPKHGFQAAQEDLPPIPTSLSLLMNTVPQNSLAGVFPKVDLMSQHDPWADMALAVTDDERDSGSSANSEALQDFRSLWKSDTTFSSSCGDASLFSASHYQTSIESIFSM